MLHISKFIIKNLSSLVLLYIFIALLSINSLALAESTSSAHQLNLTADELLWIKKHPVIRVSNEIDWRPFDYMENGEAAGYSIDLMNKVADMLGVQFQYINGLAWGDLLQKFRDHEIDVMSAIYISESRKQYSLFTQPYFKNPPAIITRKQDDSIRSLADLKGRRVALPPDFALFETLPKEVSGVIMIKEIEGKPIESTIDALKAVVVGKADAVVESAATLTHQIERNGLPNLKIAAYPSFKHTNVNDYDLYAAVRHDWPVFHRILVKAFDNISQEEKLELQKKWFGMATIVSRDKLSLTALENNYIARNSVIRYCIDPYWMPYEALDDQQKHIGMTAELIQKLEELLNIPFHVVPTTSWQKSLEYIKNGDCDLLPAAAETTDRKNYLVFSKPVFELPLVIAIHQDDTFIQDVTELKNRKIAVAKGYAHIDLIRSAYPWLELTQVDNLAEGIQQVRKGQAFAVVDTVPTIRYALARNNIEDIKIGGQLGLMLKLSFATRRGTEEELSSIVTKALDAFPVSELEALRNRWNKIEVEKVMDTRLLWQVALVSITVIALILVWNRKLAKVTKELNEANMKLERLSRIDDLTNLLNRRAFFNELNDELVRIKRTASELSILLVDADHFKKINDTFGHATGDFVLKEIANNIREAKREIDIAGRLGGEEFVIALPETDSAGASHIAERLRSQIAEIDLSLEEQPIKVSVSIGIATLKANEKFESLLHRADTAMYMAKKNGRNRVEIA